MFALWANIVFFVYISPLFFLYFCEAYTKHIRNIYEGYTKHNLYSSFLTSSNPLHRITLSSGNLCQIRQPHFCCFITLFFYKWYYVFSVVYVIFFLYLCIVL